MYTGLKHAHNGLAYLFLLLMLFALFYIAMAYLRRQPYTNTVKKVSLVGLISAHLQLVIGLILYFGPSPMGFSNLNGESMKNSAMRLFALEHPLMMILGIILITVGYSRAKRASSDAARYKSLLVFYGLGLLFILSRIPWHIWPNW
jgi:uncharacterized membrane protein